MSSTGMGRPGFTRTRFRSGYAVEDVDAFLDAVFSALASGQSPPDIDSARFRPTRFAPGYDMTEVDAFLEELASGLSR